MTPRISLRHLTPLVLIAVTGCQSAKPISDDAARRRRGQPDVVETVSVSPPVASATTTQPAPQSTPTPTPKPTPRPTPQPTPKPAPPTTTTTPPATQTTSQTQSQPIETTPPPASTTPAVTATAPTEWWQQTPAPIEGRLRVVASGSGGSARDARQAAVDAGIAALAKLHGSTPDAPVFERTHVTRENDEYIAYVLVSCPR